MRAPAQVRHELIIVCGNAGVGKTTYGLALAGKRNAFLLDIDTVSERLVRAGLGAAEMDKNDRDSATYKSIYRVAIHETLFDIACENLSHHPCIIVAPFTQERRDPGFLSWCEDRVHASVEIHVLICSESLRRERLISRNNERDKSKLDNWDTYSAHGRDPSDPPFAHILVNTDD